MPATQHEMACSATLLARHGPRSDDPEASCPGDAWPFDDPPIHHFTGTFADSTHTVAFRSKVFRLVFPVHVVALMLTVCAYASVVSSSTEHGQPLATYWPCLLMTCLLGLSLGARIALHFWEDEAKAQRFGVYAWAITVVFGCILDFIDYASAVPVHHVRPVCERSSMHVYPLVSTLFAVINASHGMEFGPTALLAGLVMCDFTAVRTVCTDSTPVDLAIVALVVTFGVGHFAQLLGRHAFLQTEHLQTSRERLQYDLQLYMRHSSRARLPAVTTPAEPSAQTSTNSEVWALRCPRRSAPSAMIGKWRPAPDADHEEAGERSWDQPPEPGVAGPSGLPPPSAPPSIISTDDYGPSYTSPSAAYPNPAPMQLLPLFLTNPPPAGDGATVAAAASVQPPPWLNEEQAFARLAWRWGARMWGFVRLLFLGLTAPASPLRLLDQDSLRHIIYHVLLNSGISRVAIESRRAPWAAMLCPVLAARRLAANAPHVQRPRRTLARSLSWSYPARRSVQDHFLESITPRLRRSKSWSF